MVSVWKLIIYDNHGDTNTQTEDSNRACWIHACHNANQSGNVMLRRIIRKMEVLLLVYEWLQKQRYSREAFRCRLLSLQVRVRSQFCSCRWLCSVKFRLRCLLWNTLDVPVYVLCALWDPLETVDKWGNSVPDHTFLICLTAPFGSLCLICFKYFISGAYPDISENFILFSLILQTHILSFKRMLFFHTEHQNCHYCTKFQVSLSSYSYFDGMFTNTQLKVVLNFSANIIDIQW